MLAYAVLRAPAQAIAARFPWDRYKTFLDFTAADWVREAGFREMRTEPLMARQSMIVAIK